MSWGAVKLPLSIPLGYGVFTPVWNGLLPGNGLLLPSPPPIAGPDASLIYSAAGQPQSGYAAGSDSGATARYTRLLSGKPPPPCFDISTILNGPVAAYPMDRGLGSSSIYTYGTMGRSLDAWVMHEMVKAGYAGRRTFTIVVLGPGFGNTEKELAQAIAPLAARLGMEIEITTYSLPRHPLSEDNVAAILEAGGSHLHLTEVHGDFDVEPFPKADIIYGIMSTIYSESFPRLTAKIHNALRSPDLELAGGEAFFMYGNYLNIPPFLRGAGLMALLECGLDITVTPRSFAHMRRISKHPIDARLLLQAPRDGVAKSYRITRETGPSPLGGRSNTPPDDIDDTALAAFLHGAHLLLQANGIDPGTLPDGEEEIERDFHVAWPSIKTGQPIYPDAIGSVYGPPGRLDVIGRNWERPDDKITKTGGGSRDADSGLRATLRRYLRISLQ